ncbi:hypothetical protein D3C86_1517050 [compost metagenome]
MIPEECVPLGFPLHVTDNQHQTVDGLAAIQHDVAFFVLKLNYLPLEIEGLAQICVFHLGVDQFYRAGFFIDYGLVLVVDPGVERIGTP